MIPIFDGHVDTLTKLWPSFKDGRDLFFTGSEGTHVDLPRILESGLIGALFSIFVPPPYESSSRDEQEGLIITKTGFEVSHAKQISDDYAKAFTDEILKYLHHLIRCSEDKLSIVRSPADLAYLEKDDVISMVLHLEGAEAIKPDLKNLEVYYNNGVRSIGLVWSRPNYFGQGVPFKFPHYPDTGPGLTSRGKKLVEKCVDMGIMIDLAHINAKGFNDVKEISTRPLVVSHSNVHDICPSTRNLTDDQIDAIGDSNGLIGISCIPENARMDGNHDANTPISTIIDHIDYVRNRIGIDHVALGSDLDGGLMPNSIKDITGLQKIMDALKDINYPPRHVEKIAWKNWQRVLKDSWS